MSLIHEALRKARRESAKEENRGVVYARGLTGRRGRPGIARGIGFGVLLTVALGAVIGGAVWLRLGHRDAPGRAAADTTADLPTLASPAVTAAGRSAAAAPPPAPSASATADPSPSSGPAAPIAGPSPAVEPAPETRAGTASTATPTGGRESRSAGNRPPTGAPPRPTRAAVVPGEREFAVEADLGYATLTLDYIVFRPTDPFAQINGIDVRVGSTIEGFVVDEIDSGAVRLHDRHGPLILRAQ